MTHTERDLEDIDVRHYPAALTRARAFAAAWFGPECRSLVVPRVTDNPATHVPLSGEHGPRQVLGYSREENTPITYPQNPADTRTYYEQLAEWQNAPERHLIDRPQPGERPTDQNAPINRRLTFDLASLRVGLYSWDDLNGSVTAHELFLQANPDLTAPAADQQTLAPVHVRVNLNVTLTVEIHPDHTGAYPRTDEVEQETLHALDELITDATGRGHLLGLRLAHTGAHQISASEVKPGTSTQDLT